MFFDMVVFKNPPRPPSVIIFPVYNVILLPFEGGRVPFWVISERELRLPDEKTESSRAGDDKGSGVIG